MPSPRRVDPAEAALHAIEPRSTALGAYRLLDCGDERRLERFGDWLADRPAPSALGPRREPAAWHGATSFKDGTWHATDERPLPSGPVAVGLGDGLVVEVGPGPSGGVGVFPEHLAARDWIRAAVRRRVVRAPSPSDDPAGSTGPRVLNLFAHTGLVTLVVAHAGAAVTHVDASRPAVSGARRNAGLSGLADHPIRWIVDDAAAFVAREARRGRRYDGLILDPPSYGHGAAGGRSRRGRSDDGRGRGHRSGASPTWRLQRDLEPLLLACLDIAAPDAFWLLSAHTPGWDEDALAALLDDVVGVPGSDAGGAPLVLRAESGAVLPLGASARLDPLTGADGQRPSHRR